MNFSKKIIFDFGCNIGQNFKYFLKKADIVIAVEANPYIYKNLIKKYHSQIEQKKLIIFNIALVKNQKLKNINFYIHNTHSEGSSLFPMNNYDYKKVKVRCSSASSLVKNVLKKYKNYTIENIKIDLEGSDIIVLKDLLKNKIISKNLSIEANDENIIYELYNSPYKSFNISNFEAGKSNFEVSLYGDDLKGGFLDKRSMFLYFVSNKCGWIDINCSLEKKKYKNYEILDLVFVYINQDSKNIKRIIKGILILSRMLIIKLLNKFKNYLYQRLF